MAPIPEPGPTAPRCPRCGAPLPEPKPPYCPRCGMALNERPIWLTVVATLGAIFLGFAALGLGAFGACVALLMSGESSTSTTHTSDMLWIWGILIGAVVCAVAAIAILVWVIKKPKPK